MEYQYQVLVAFFLFGFLMFRLLKKPKSSSLTSHLPPGPCKLPIIGNLHLLVGSDLPHHRLTDISKKYGAVMRFQLGEVPAIVISSPETAKHVFQAHDVIFSDRPFVFAANILMYNSCDIAFSSYGNYWRQLRKICTVELLSAKRVKSFKSIREKEVSSFIETIGSNVGLPINLSAMVLSLTFTLTSSSAFGNLGKKELSLIPLIQKIIKALGGFSIGDVFPSLKLLHVISGVEAKLRRLHQEVDRILEDIVSEHKARKAKVNNDPSNATDDFIDVLLNLQDHGGLPFTLTTDNIKALILDIFVAGTETTATVVEWAMSELVKNPRVMKEAQTEIRQVCGQKGTVDESSLHMLGYLKAVIKETLRLHPPAPFLAPRQNREKVQINGYDIPKKSYVIINMWAMARDPNYWTEAEKFHPQRFLTSPIDYMGSNFQFIPFGAGRRICPGISLGIATVELLLANLLFHFDWKCPGGMNPQDLDMSESLGLSIRRLRDLSLIPLPHHPLGLDYNG